MSSSSSSTTIGTITVPLTTIFTPPGWCTNLGYTYQKKVSGISQFIRDVDGPGDGRTSSCYPPDFGVFKTGISYGIYSPAVCLSGWFGKTIEHSLLSPTVFWSMCCPIGFTASLFPNAGWSCQSTVNTPTTVALDENTFVQVSTQILIADWPIFIAWESSDLDRFTPASAPLLTSTPSTRSRTKASIPTQTQSAGSSSVAKSNEGLSTGTQVGIGVGVALAGLAIIAVLSICSTGRKRRQQFPPKVAVETISSISLRS